MSQKARVLVFDRDILAGLAHRVVADRKVALKIFQLVEAVHRDPFSDLRKPEPLCHVGSGVWSRRITQEHRLVYVVK
ncbi:MAG: Txe/YoeB family addiction module toxin [Opitutaceae bacterium]|nr:Txe/YoeB family addiction module toxin [Opitutaceae bacterium]